jgi:hypothetical protein
LPRIAQSDPASGYLMEALTTAMADADEAKEPGRTFLDKRSQMTALL